MSNLVKHAKSEFKVAGWMDEDGNFKDEMQGLMCSQILELLELFSSHGHSGFSANYAIDLFSKLAEFKTLTPLTGNASEWQDVGNGMLQNKRDSRIFKDHAKFGGQAYNLDGKIFWEWCERDLEPDEDGYPGKKRFKSYFTSRDRCLPIVFPYTPTSEYVEVVREEV